MNYKIGLITKTRGIRGEVVVKQTTEFPRFQPNKTIYLYIDEQKINLKIKNVRKHKNILLVSFYGYNDINEVEKFKGKELYTDEEPILDENEYHEKDIINKEVYSVQNKYLGNVVGLMEAPQGYLLRIGNKEKSFLVPFSDYFIKSIDEDKIIINEIEGLL